MARTGAPRLAHWAGYDVRGAVDAHRGAACSVPFIVLKRQTVKEPKHNPNMLLSLKRPRCAAAVAATTATHSEHTTQTNLRQSLYRQNLLAFARIPQWNSVCSLDAYRHQATTQTLLACIRSLTKDFLSVFTDTPFREVERGSGRHEYIRMLQKHENFRPPDGGF